MTWHREKEVVTSAGQLGSTTQSRSVEAGCGFCFKVVVVVMSGCEEVQVMMK